MLWQETFWLKRLSELSCSVNQHSANGFSHLPPDTIAPMDDLSVIRWLQDFEGTVPSTSTVSQMCQNMLQLTAQHNANAMKTPSQRWKLWLVSDDWLENESSTIPSILALFTRFGTLPPMPTAIFPCDCSTRSSAVREMVWRLKKVSSILDDTASTSSVLQSDELLDVVRRVVSIFLCAGVIVVTRPDTLQPQEQDALLDGLGESLNKTLILPLWPYCQKYISHHVLMNRSILQVG